MSKTVDFVHHNVHRKLTRIKDIIGLLEESAGPSRVSSTYLYKAVRDRYQEAEDSYDTSTISALMDYRNNMPGSDKQYFEALMTHNVEGQIDECISLCRDILLSDEKAGTIAVIRAFEDIGQINLGMNIERVDYEHCCGNKMDQLPASSQLYCRKCNKSTEIKGMVFEDAQFYSQEGKKTKHGKYDPIRTYNKWVDDILACSPFHMTEDKRKRIEGVVRRDGYGEPGRAIGLTLTIIREILQELNMTDANSSAAYLLAILSGVWPPVFTVSDRNRINTYYLEAIKAYRLLLADEPRYGKPKKDNTPYCPYFIWKIIEDQWWGDAEKLRIFNYIHMKKPATVMKQDNKWSQICKRIGIRYRPTDYTKCD